MTDAPPDTPHPHRDSRGRWIAGCPGGPGRTSRGIDVFALVARKEAEGYPLGEAVWQVLEALRVRALAGDVVAAREWLARVCRKEAPGLAEDILTLEQLVLASLTDRATVRDADVVRIVTHDPVADAEAEARGLATPSIPR